MRRPLLVPTAGLLVGALATGGVLLAASPGGAISPAPDVLVAERAAASTAQLVATDGVRRPRVDALARTNGVVYLGGLFERVTDESGNYNRNDIAAVDESSGQVLTSFAPQVSARVFALAAQGDAVYMGGIFRNVNGVSRPFLVKVDATTGAVIPGFNARLRGRVNALEIVGDKLVVAGAFGKKLVAVDLDTGADTGYIDINVGGEVLNSWGNTALYDIAVDPAGTRLVAVGNFLTVNGQVRNRAFMLDLGVSSATLAPWYYDDFTKDCSTDHPRRVAYLQGVDFGPDGSYFVMAATGQVPETRAELGEMICDAAGRFETDIVSPDKPTWINYTGGDSVWTAAATEDAVYVMGHFQWLDNELGIGSQPGDDGAMRRRGIGAIDPDTGAALAWDPPMPSAIGGKAFLGTPAGLWVGSDARRFAGREHRGLAFVPVPSP